MSAVFYYKPNLDITPLVLESTAKTFVLYRGDEALTRLLPHLGFHMLDSDTLEHDDGRLVYFVPPSGLKCDTLYISGTYPTQEVLGNFLTDKFDLWLDVKTDYRSTSLLEMVGPRVNQCFLQLDGKLVSVAGGFDSVVFSPA